MTPDRKTKTQTRAKSWLTPDQVEELRNACYQGGVEYLRQRDEAIITLLYDAGLRVGELVEVDVEDLRESNSVLYLPSHKQKQYPNDNTPAPAQIELSNDTQRILTSYLQNRWKDTNALFPSRQRERITTESIRNLLKRVSRRADVHPYLVEGGRGDPDDVTPHTLRHSVAYRMMNHEEDNTLYDVRNRLRHSSLTTTEEVYDHFKRV